jgi:PIN domain nuclease of toxin-antitoxin system
MIVYVLDSSALLRFIDYEAGADRVRTVLRECVFGQSEVCISAVQWGEVAGKLRKRLGPGNETYALTAALPEEAKIVPATADRAVHAAQLKVDRNLAYADGFALDLAMESQDYMLLTADDGFKSVEDLARIEFLPTK